MGIYREIIHLDDVYHDTKGKSLVSDYNDIEDPNELLRLKEKLMTTYNDDIVSMIPSCSCGLIKENHNINKVCVECGTTCKLTFSTFEPEVFMGPLIENVKWVNPVFLAILEDTINTKISILRWVGDRQYNPPLGKQEMLINSLTSIPGFVRSYGWFVANIPILINFLINSPIIKSMAGKVPRLKQVLEVYYTYEKQIFSDYLPLVNKKMFIVVKTNGLGDYGNNGIGQTFDLALLYIKAENSDNELFQMNYIMKILHHTAKLYTTLASDFFGEKEGIYEKHLHGARLPFSSRTVIISIDEKHDADEVYLSWGVGITKFRPHLLNKLLRRGWKYKDASMLLFNYVNVYHPLLDELLEELLVDCPLKGIPMVHQRN
ncbi:MAG: hypothetical protein DRP93_04815 [Candidatus Neomarinimicrobiota bacterium]|nr:MAG: hypothetical protein DRP93_04815 [Candidatus Neomarinimicrobiota bacterium]